LIADDTVEVADFDGLLGLIDRMCAPVVNPRMTPKRWQTVIAFLEEMERRIFAEERSQGTCNQAGGKLPAAG